MRIVYLANGRLHLLCDDGIPRVVESQFGQSIRDRAVRISQRDSWKNEGAGAQFMSGRLLWGCNGFDPAEMRIANWMRRMTRTFWRGQPRTGKQRGRASIFLDFR